MEDPEGQEDPEGLGARLVDRKVHLEDEVKEMREAGPVQLVILPVVDVAITNV